jgi:hypothetical protein
MATSTTDQPAFAFDRDRELRLWTVTRQLLSGEQP